MKRWYDFNISHHGNWVVLAATDRADLHVGIDIVCLDDFEESVLNLVKTFGPQVSDSCLSRCCICLTYLH